MDSKKLKKAAEPSSIGDHLVKLSQQHSSQPHQHSHSVRTAEHKGHKIVIETHYKITVDGKPLDLPLGVDDSGEVHCHSLPNYQFLSVVDLVKVVIDLFPDEIGGSSGHDHDSMKPPKREGTKKAAKKKTSKSSKIAKSKKRK